MTTPCRKVCAPAHVRPRRYASSQDLQQQGRIFEHYVIACDRTPIRHLIRAVGAKREVYVSRETVQAQSGFELRRFSRFNLKGEPRCQGLWGSAK